MSTLKATNIKNESSASNNIVLDSGGGVVVSGILTATTFSGNVSGDLTGNATGLTGTPNLNVGIVTATSFVGDGSGLTGIGGGGNEPYFSANGESTVTLPHNTNVEVTDYTETYDSGGYFASGRFTPQVAGTYFIITNQNLYTNNKRASFEVNMWKNGLSGVLIAQARDMIGSVDTTWRIPASVSGISTFNGTTDYVSVFVASYNYTDATDQSYYSRSFSAFRIGD